MQRIDLIIDALEKAKDGWQSFDEYTEALAAARELRALKPTHYVDHKNERNIVHYDLWKSFDDCEILRERYTVPLYALDNEVKHD